MTIEFPCPECAQLVRTPDAAAGKRGKCPSCAAVVQIPTAKPAAKETPAQPSVLRPTATKPAAEDTSPIEFFCSSCGQLVRTPRAAAGKKGKCPHCAEIVLIPLTNKPVTPAARASASPAPQLKVEEDIVQAELDESPLPPKAALKSQPAPKPATAFPKSAPQPAPPAPLAALPLLTPLGPAAVDPFASFGGAPFPGGVPLPAANPGLVPLPALIPLNAPLDLNSAPILAEAISSPSPAFSHPFASLPAASPFATSLPAAKSSAGNHDTAVNIPAILQLVVTVPMLLLYGFTLLRQIWGFINLALMLSRTQSPASNYAAGLILNILISLLVTVACVVMQSWIIFGSSKQLQRRSYNQALAAAWMSLIPCVSPMGMPFGIWSLVMLYKDPVKRGFRG